MSIANPPHGVLAIRLAPLLAPAVIRLIPRRETHIFEPLARYISTRTAISPDVKALVSSKYAKYRDFFEFGYVTS